MRPPASWASATHSSMVTPRTGTNGSTSVAPRRGCWPECRRRSINSAARATERKSAWERLEDLLSLLDRSSLRRLHREEVRELGHIYRRTASDLAIARAESRDPRLINYLNSLVIRAHGRIYRADAHGGQRIRGFFEREFPRTFRRAWRYIAVSFGVFLMFSG